MDMLTGQPVATDSITLHGQPPVILPNQSHKHLGLRIAMDGNFSAEKENVRTKQLLKALGEDRVLSQKEKERVITISVCSIIFLEILSRLNSISSIRPESYMAEQTIFAGAGAWGAANPPTLTISWSTTSEGGSELFIGATLESAKFLPDRGPGFCRTAVPRSSEAIPSLHDGARQDYPQTA